MTFQMDAIEDDELPPSDPTTATGHTRQFNFVNEAAEPLVDDGPLAGEIEGEQTLQAPSAIPHYASLTVPEIEKHLDYLSEADLRAVEQFERSHRVRESLLEQLARRMSDHPRGSTVPHRHQTDEALE